MKRAPFRVVVADPAWLLRDALPGPRRGSVKHYRCLPLDEIKRFPMPPVADDALLFLWRVAALGDEAYDVMRAWGFVPKAELVWVKHTRTGKRHFGMGSYVRNCHEICLIGRRGRARVRARNVRSVFDAPVGEHSRKPDEFYEIVESLSDGPYLELFARRRRDGWTCLGDEI